jgi:hypothetical protein
MVGVARVTFLTPDVADAYDHRGCTPNPTEALSAYTAKAEPSRYVPYDLRKLADAKVEPYYIYSRRYCGAIGRALGANLFVMTRLVRVGVGPGGECRDDLYDFELKAGMPRCLLNRTAAAAC